MCISARAQDGFCMVNGATTGGAGGPTVTVTNGTDFITQVGMTGARIVQVSGVLTIGDATVRSDKTIIGVSSNATLLGRLAISGVSNIIVQNLRITNPGNDGMSIRDPNTHHVWVDHVTFYDCGDGSCDISQGADYVTVSWCKFMYPTQLEHRFAMIADGPKDLGPLTARITLHHNWWSTRADQRMAATSDALVHYYNNYFNCTNNSYCSNARDEAELNSENNYYAGVKDPIGISSGTTGKIKTSGNLYIGCSGTIHPGTDTVFTPPYAYTPDATIDVSNLVTTGAGAPGPNTAPIPPKIWDGGGANNNLNTANNWGFDETPKEYDTLTFAGSTRLAPNNNYTANSEFASLTFGSNAGAFVLAGNALNLGVGLTNDNAATQTINLNLDFAYAVDHFSLSRYFNVTAPNGSLVLNGRIAGTTNRIYSVTKLGPGLLTLAGINTFPGVFNFNGGLVRFSSLSTNVAGSLGACANLNFNGGGLRWAAGNTADISINNVVTINAGGATFDVGANHVTLTNRVGNNGAGGLTKLGTGTLTCNATNSYKGNTLIAEGTLALGVTGLLTSSPQIVLSNNATLDVSGRSDSTLTLVTGKSLGGNGMIRGSVIAASGATIAPGFSIGTLAITNVLTLQSGSTNLMELDAAAHTNDLITGMVGVTYGGSLLVTNLGGTLAAGDTFKLFSAASYTNSFTTVMLPPLGANLFWTNRLATDGTLRVLSTVNTNPTAIVGNLVGTNLQISWPEDRIGSRLEARTNSLIAGDWFTISNSVTTNFIVIPIAPENQSMYFRLIYP